MWMCSIHIASSQNFWRPLDGMYGGDITAMVITHDGTLFAGTQTGIYRSTDNGNHWIPAHALQKNSKTLCLLESNGILFAGNDDGIFRSTNNGVSWTNVWFYIDNPQFSTITSLAVDPSGVLYASSNNVLCSTDQGEHWVTAFTYTSSAFVAVGPRGFV